MEIPEPIRIRTLEELLERIAAEPLTDEISKNEITYFHILKNLERINYKSKKDYINFRSYLFYAQKYVEMISAKMDYND